MNTASLIIAPLIAMMVISSLICATAMIAAAKASSHTTRMLAKRYPLLSFDDPS